MALVFIVSCSGDNNQTSASGDSGGTGTSTGGPTSAAATTVDDPTGTTAETPTGGTTETGDTSGVKRAVCDRYLACVAVVAPGSLPGAQQGFGEGGTCWEGTMTEMEQCLEACQAGLEQLHMASPDEPKCALCQTAEDCGADEACVDGECRGANCGDAVVDSNEVCDDPEYCDDDCGGPSACSPFNGAGCVGDDVCVFDDNVPVCVAERGLLPEGEACETGLCAEGLTCINLAGCNTPGTVPCCRVACNSTQSGTCPVGESCTSMEELGPIGGFDPPAELAKYIGLCK